MTETTVLNGERRPDARLRIYYVLYSLMWGPLVVFSLPYLMFRFRTLRYTFDDEGVTVRWGILFRREITLTYARIQDIHLVSNVVERWLGLGRIEIQTASGSSSAEMEIEGLPDFEPVRDALYARMRGVRSSEAAGPGESSVLADVARSLDQVAAELRALREDLKRRA